jgi:hypothetical protein
MFVDSSAEETVQDDRGNVVWIRSKMDIRTAALVSSDMVKMTGGGGVFAIIAHEVCLARRNIKRWAGPDFTGPDGKIIPCTPDNIDKLDPNEPLYADVVAKIKELNKRKEAEATPEEKAADPSSAANVS